MKTLIFICFISFQLQYCARSYAETLTSVIVKDINAAFNIVTNSTVLLKNLLPEMNNVSSSKADMVFKLPKADGNCGTMEFMHRTDFMDPKFPNLTSQYMELMKERRHIYDSAEKIHANLYLSADKGKNDWAELGLEGWTGEVSRPSEYYQHKEMHGHQAELRNYNLHQIVSHHIGNYDHTNTTIDFYNNGIGHKVTVLNGNYERDGDVYIARVNDPFGFSTKWELRNHTNLENEDLSHNSDIPDDRLKRDVVTLYSMIKCSTGCEPLFYKGYGCYCGFLGAGIPADGIDRCCKLHDKCYENSNCISYLEYFVPYIWKCYRGKPLCAIDHGEFGGPQSCAARLCYCDMRLSRCLRKFACPRRRAICRTSAARQLQNFLLF